MASNTGSGGEGCWVLFAGLMIVALIVAGLISLAAIVDPFSWMPSVSEVWEDCREDYGDDRNECDLHVRFPGFWVHALVNLVYFVIATLLLLGLWSTVAELRAARAARFSGVEAANGYVQKRATFAGVAVVTALWGIVPIVVAAL